MSSLIKADSFSKVAAAAVSRDGQQFEWTAGQSEAGPVSATDSRFLVASLTKPIVATAALKIASRGQLTLNDRVVDWLPEFTGSHRRSITIRHLLTHTAGLPEVWEDNIELRRASAGLDAFVASGCRADLVARPSHTASYSSVGFSLLGAVIERVEGKPLREVIRDIVFDPLGMSSSELGAEFNAGGDPVRGPIVRLRLRDEDEDNVDWNWNSRYWLALGAPWGGIVSTASDILALLKSIAGWGKEPFLPPAVRDSAWSNQLREMGVRSADAARRGWGLGWRLNWPSHSAALSELLSADAVGHYGATGSVMWVTRDFAAVILTDEPIGRRPRALQLASNAIVSELSTQLG